MLLSRIDLAESAGMTLSLLGEFLIDDGTSAATALARRFAQRAPVALPTRVHARFFFPIPDDAPASLKERMRNGRVRPKVAVHPLLRRVLDALVGTAVVDETCIVEEYGEAWFAEHPRTELRLHVQTEGDA